MGRYAQLVIGPAGCGKSTYCTVMQRHLSTIKRPHLMINLDPAAEDLRYEPMINIRDLISLEEAMEECELGPNGGLVFCMEYLLENIDWLEEEIGTEWEDEYIIIDCPGQIELFTHTDIMKRLIKALEQLHIRVCAVYLLESQFIADSSKFFSGVLTAISAMVQLEVPHVNILSKMDFIEGRPGQLSTDPKDPKAELANTFTEEEEELAEKRREAVRLDLYVNPTPHLLLDENKKSKGKWKGLNEAIVHLIEEFDMVSFVPLNIFDQSSIEYAISCIDQGIQFGEDEEPKEPISIDDQDEIDQVREYEQMLDDFDASKQ